MLSEADRRLIARDKALPGLGAVLDAGELAGLLQSGPLIPLHLRYKTGVSAAAAFARQGEDGLDGTFSVYTYPAARYAEVQKRDAWRQGATPARFFDDLHLVAVPLRLDRGLSLRRLPDLPALLGRLAGEADLRLRVLRYKPRRRLVLRLDREGVPFALAKIYSQADFGRARFGAGIAGAPVLGISERHRVIVWRWLEGRPLGPDRCEAADMAEAGAALAAFHCSPLRPPFAASRRFGLESVPADLVPLSPDLAAIAERLVVRLAPCLQAEPAVDGPIHGDFSPDQVIVADSVARIIDWDRIGTGDPGQDTGRFLGQLDARAVQGELSEEQAREAGAAFQAGYERIAPLPAATALHRAATLLLLATEGFRSRRPRWPEETRQLLLRAEAQMNAPAAIAAESRLPLLARALDPATMAPRLATALGCAADAIRLRRPELLRVKPGRRALIAYLGTAEGRPFEVYGKHRAKGPDRRTPALHDHLRLALPDGAGVPANLGRLDDLHLWLQPKMPGPTAAALLRPGAGHVFSAQVGAALAALHSAPVPDGLRHWTVQDEMAVLEKALVPVSALSRQGATRVAHVLAGMRHRLEALPDVPLRGIHRDFYFDQVLLDGPRTWLLDLDLFCLGDPAADIGNYLGHVAELALRRHGDAEAMAEHEAAFLSGYAGSGPPPDRHRIGTFRLVTLARHIGISLRFPDRAATTAPLLDLVERLLAEEVCQPWSG